MKPLRLLYHVSCKPPAYLEHYLQRRQYPYEIICLDEDTPVPDDLDSISGLILMGGAGNVNEPTSWMNRELAVIQQAAAIHLPVMGICLGAQLISKALGGVVSRGSSLEVGWHSVQQLNGHDQQWFAELPSSFEVFQWHEHTFALPPGAIPLACSDCFDLQAFSLSNILAMQFHLEMTPELIESLIERYACDIENSSSCVQNAESIRTDIMKRSNRLQQTADAVYDRWMKIVNTK